MHLFKGANHRFTTLGHDPLLGLVFGTSNILTNTISLTPKSENVLKNLPINLEKVPLANMLSISMPKTYQVVYTELKNPKIWMPVSAAVMLQAAMERLEDDKKAVAAAVIKQLLHIATDMYTPSGIQLPGAGIVLSNTTVEQLTDYISTGDIVKVEASAGRAVLINTIISAVHGCKLLFEDDGQDFSREMYQARTRKIVMYSNVIATSSNVITTALGDTTSLDIGGLLVTLYRVFSDIRFISKLEYEFINTKLSKLYEEEYKGFLE